MIRCESCAVTAVEGTLFCTECGASLLDTRGNKGARAYQYAHFLILDNGRKQKVSITGTEPVMIGRSDPENGYWPQLDFSDDGGVEKGVSRQHAMIQAAPGEVLLIDQDSVNGTWINEVRLEPDQPYPLPAAGHLRFGGLDVHIILE